MIKKQLLLLVMILLPMVASADAVEIDGIYYNLIPKGKVAEVTSNPGKYAGTVIIPADIIYEDISYSVTSIGNSAFFDCSDLISVTIPNSVTSIGSDAFYYCSGLSSITIPNSVTSIGSFAFSSCSGLSSVTIPNNVTSIDEGAFSGCSGLTSVTIGNNVTIIGYHAFSDCSGLTSIYITDIESWCKISFNSYYSNPLCYAHCLYMNGSEITNLVIPNSVTSIGNYAFIDCSGLISVTIPNSVTSIGNSAFSYCSNLTSVIIPNSVMSIGDRAFEGSSNLTSVTIGNSVTTIGGSAFMGCSGLTSVAIGNSVTSIGGEAFYQCSGLTFITIPNSVVSIGGSAFQNCSGLTSVTIGSGIRKIGTSAFASCSKLIDVYCYAENVPKTQSGAFNDSYIEYATLHVPDASVTIYAQTAPWNGFKSVVGLSGTAPTKCATPTITILNGKLSFECETEGVSFNASYSYNSGNGNVVGKELILAGTTTAHVSVYATKEGYLDSEVATADVELCVGKKGDVNQDGVVSITDAVSVVNIMQDGEAAAPAMESPNKGFEAE